MQNIRRSTVDWPTAAILVPLTSPALTQLHTFDWLISSSQQVMSWTIPSRLRQHVSFLAATADELRISWHSLRSSAMAIPFSKTMLEIYSRKQICFVLQIGNALMGRPHDVEASSETDDKTTAERQATSMNGSQLRAVQITTHLSTHWPPRTNASWRMAELAYDDRQ
jgi:hypothetical protein